MLNETIFGKGTESCNGMIERWLFCCSEYLETGILLNTDSEYDILDFINPCNKIFDEYEPCEKDGKLSKMFYLSKEAHQKFQEVSKRIADIKKSEKLMDIEKTYIEKQKSYIARFAMILHALHNVSKDEISLETVNKALHLSKYFIDTFRHTIDHKIAYDKLETHTLNYLRNKNLKIISPTALYKNNRSKFKTAQNAGNTLESLARKGYGRLIKASNGCKFIFYNG